MISGHAANFINISIRPNEMSTLLVFTQFTQGTPGGILNITEIGLQDKSKQFKQKSEINYAYEAGADFPVAIQITDK